MKSIPRYIASPAKTLEVILWLANAENGIGVYHLVKAIYFADRYHLSRYGRPISGDNFEAAPYGPLPRLAYDMLRNDPIVFLLMEANGPLPVGLDDQRRVVAGREPALSKLSESDIAALEHGLEQVRGRSFRDLFDETHAHPAYIQANGGLMDPREFLDVAEQGLEEKRQDIAETAGAIAF